MSLDDMVDRYLAGDPTRAERLSDATKELGRALIEKQPTLVHLRMLRGLSQKQLAAKIGQSQSALSLIENGMREPTLSTIIDLMKALNLTWQEIGPALQATQHE